MVERKIEKHIVSILHSNLGTTQQVTSIVAPSEMRTHTRVVGNISVSKDSTATAATIGLAIVVVREGQSALTISLTNATEFYDRPEDVLWHQTIRTPVAANADWERNIHIDVLGQRKLARNDAIKFISIGIIADSGQLSGSLTDFLKLP